MKSIRIELRYDRESLTPIHAGICAEPGLDREVILGGQAVDDVETVTSFVYGDPAAYEPLLIDLDGVLEYDITPSDRGFFLYLRRELGPRGRSLLNALARDTVVVVPPIAIRSDRTMRLTVVGHPDDLGRIFDGMPAGVTIDVLRVGDTVGVESVQITDRQRDALEAARSVGYYEIPRQNGIEAVADELGCAVSTASELLRRGEATAVDGVLDAD